MVPIDKKYELNELGINLVNDEGVFGNTVENLINAKITNKTDKLTQPGGAALGQMEVNKAMNFEEENSKSLKEIYVQLEQRNPKTNSGKSLAVSEGL